LLMWVFLYVTPVRISSIMEHLSSKLYWHHATETFHHPHSSLYKLRFGTTDFLLDSWPPEDGTSMLSQDICKILPLLTV
jgi:hypothetical protein